VGRARPDGLLGLNGTIFLPLDILVDVLDVAHHQVLVIEPYSWVVVDQLLPVLLDDLRLHLGMQDLDSAA